ncbi:unnamed protein product [Caenorhabditis angaria]|uniref:Uncharacterized protein n=1 Tax=Caenorhabditis angaria TaxID=860376 RepID=A0A9P1MV45_9PELO|nr:unnamed protein product [Caenorhabditis angaria]
MSIIFFVLTFITIHSNRHILSETRKRGELSIIYQNIPIVLGFLIQYFTSFVIHFIRVQNDSRDVLFQSFLCNDLTSVNLIFPTIYTVANFGRLRTLLSKLFCCLRFCYFHKRNNRVSDGANTTVYAIEANPVN